MQGEAQFLSCAGNTGSCNSALVALIALSNPFHIIFSLKKRPKETDLKKERVLAVVFSKYLWRTDGKTEE